MRGQIVHGRILFTGTPEGLIQTSEGLETHLPDAVYDAEVPPAIDMFPSARDSKPTHGNHGASIPSRPINEVRVSRRSEFWIKVDE